MGSDAVTIPQHLIPAALRLPCSERPRGFEPPISDPVTVPLVRSQGGLRTLSLHHHGPSHHQERIETRTPYQHMPQDDMSPQFLRHEMLLFAQVHQFFMCNHGIMGFLTRRLVPLSVPRITWLWHTPNVRIGEYPVFHQPLSLFCRRTMHELVFVCQRHHNLEDD